MAGIRRKSFNRLPWSIATRWYRSPAMDFRAIERPPNAWQASVSKAEVLAMCRQLLGDDIAVKSAVELGDGSYNNTFRVELEDRPVILRVAPRGARDFLSEWEMMRNEYAALPFLAVVAPLLPRVLGVDFTHEVVDRDYMVQAVLPGVPGAEAITSYDRSLLPHFYGQLAAVARQIHFVTGASFGSVAAPKFHRWSEALIASLEDAISDLERRAVATGDIRELAAHVRAHEEILDEIDRPRLLHGDLWTSNVMLQRGSELPTIVGIFDAERASWGDPMADWVVYRVEARKVASEREAFWQGYGERDESTNAQLRQQIYRARRIVEVRVESCRTQNRLAIEQTYEDLAEALIEIRQRPT